MNENAKRNLIWPLIALSCVPLLFIIKLPSNFTVATVSLYVSALAGYVGLMFLLWMYMLGAKSAMGLVFKDLAPVLRIHKKLGKWGAIAFLVHPACVAISYFSVSLQALLYMIVPNFSTAFEFHATLGRFAFYAILVIWVTSKFFRSNLGFRVWKNIHYFAYLGLFLALLHAPDVGSQYAHSLGARIYFWLIALTFLAFTIIRVRGLFNKDRSSYTVTKHTQLGPEDYMLVLKPSKGETPIMPIAGQYIYVKQGYFSEDHPFSVAYINQETNELTIIYRLFGPFTKFMSRLKAGAKVSLMGPFGTFTYDLQENPDRPAVYLAGGIGITPFMQRILDNKNREQYLFSANRTHDSAAMLGDLRGALGSHLVAIYSREPTAGLNEESGHMSTEILTKYVQKPERYHYYICGSKPYYAECQKILKNLHIPESHIHTEKFSW